VRNWLVVDRSVSLSDADYAAAVRMRLDTTLLPKPFQLSALTSRELHLESPWKRFTVRDPQHAPSLAALLIALPRLAGYGAIGALGQVSGPSMMPRVSMRYFVMTAVFWMFGCLFNLTTIRICVAWFRQEEPDYPMALRTAIGLLIPAILVSILFGLGAGLGLILFFVPGIILVIRWFVAIPALVIEGTSMTGSFARSGSLTAGSRWRMLIVMLIMFTIGMLGLALVGLLTVFAARTSAMAPALFAIQIVVAMLTSLVGASLSAAIYVELCQIREGGASGGLAEIFA